MIPCQEKHACDKEYEHNGPHVLHLYHSEKVLLVGWPTELWCQQDKVFDTVDTELDKEVDKIDIYIQHMYNIDNIV